MFHNVRSTETICGGTAYIRYEITYEAWFVIGIITAHF
jgi:hypothetical protein